MANTTFNGPVRSEHGFQSIVKAASTGVITPTYLDVKFDFTGMTYAAVTTGTSVSLTADYVNAVNATGGATAQFDLPAATVGVKCAYVQRVDTHGGANTITFDCAGSDVWRTGTLIESRSGANIVYDTSAADETQLVYTCAGSVTTNFFTIGSVLYFSCWEKGIWNIGLDSSKDPLALTGAFAFAS